MYVCVCVLRVNMCTGACVVICLKTQKKVCVRCMNCTAQGAGLLQARIPPLMHAG